MTCAWLAPGGNAPEESEIARMRAEAGRLSESIVAREESLRALEGRLAAFEASFLWRLGRLYVESDGLDAEIARLLHLKRPDDPVLAARWRAA